MKRLAGAIIYVVGALMMVLSAVPCLGLLTPTLPDGKRGLTAGYLYTILGIGVALLFVGKFLTILGSRMAGSEENGETENGTGESENGNEEPADTEA